MTEVATDTIELIREDLRPIYPENHWFRKVDRKGLKDWRRGENFDENCIAAMIARGVDYDTIPLVDEWAEFFMAGSIIAALTDKEVVPPGKSTYFLDTDMSIFIWGTLWRAVEESGDKLNRGFLGAALRMFYPKRHDPTGPDKPYLESRFESWWKGQRHHYGAMPMGRSRGTLTMGFMKNCHEAFETLPKNVATSAEVVARHMPKMAEITIQRIADSYHW